MAGVGGQDYQFMNLGNGCYGDVGQTRMSAARLRCIVQSAGALCGGKVERKHTFSILPQDLVKPQTECFQLPGRAGATELRNPSLDLHGGDCGEEKCTRP